MPARWLWTTVLLPLTCSGLITPGAGQSMAAIHVDVVGLHSNRGRVWCFLYNSESGFPKDQGASLARTSGGIANGRSTCDFSGVPDGSYAVSVYHDENANGRLDSNILGIPKEGVGASNDAKAHMGPPRFKDAVFRMEGRAQSLTIHINYL